MPKNIHWLFLLILGIASCAKKNDSSLTKEVKDSDIEGGQIIENDSIVFVLGRHLEELVNSKEAESVDDELIENLHSYQQSKDTIKTFKINGSKFKKYLSSDGDASLIYAEITSKIAVESDLITIGDRKTEIADRLSLNLVNDTITISNEDHTYLFVLYFSKNKLSNIIFEAYTD